MTISDVINDFDTLERKNFDEQEISNALTKLVPETNDNNNLELNAELMAFNFAENYKDVKGGWGTYFGPMFVWNNDGNVLESPSINLITPEIINYWKQRTNASTNPIIIARYSGLVFDFHNKICGTNPPYEIQKTYIEALIAVANGSFHKSDVGTYTKLKRALKLAIGLNDAKLIDECKKAIIFFENSNAQDTKPGLWGYSFDLLVGNKKVNLSKEEETEIIKELESKLIRLTNPVSDEQRIDPWAAEAAAERLASYYKKNKMSDDVKRVILEVGKAYEKIFEDASAIQVSGWLNNLYNIYTSHNLNEEADKVLLKLREIGPKVSSELKPVSHSVQIPQEEIDNYINHLTSGSVQEVLRNITIKYIPIKEEAKEKIFDLSKKSPITYIIGHQIQDEKGRVIASIGPLEGDLEGHIIRQISQNLTFSSIFLRLVMQNAIDKLSIGVDDILNFIESSPIISKDRLIIIKKGLEAYFSNDFITAVHLIIPQIEEAVRNIVEYAGGNVLKPSRGGGFHLRTFDDILRDELVKDVFGEDLADYFKILFTDQRGWNMRNNVCHGMASPDVFNHQTADRVLHALLCLGLVQETTEVMNEEQDSEQSGANDINKGIG